MQELRLFDLDRRLPEEGRREIGRIHLKRKTGTRRRHPAGRSNGDRHGQGVGWEPTGQLEVFDEAEGYRGIPQTPTRRSHSSLVRPAIPANASANSTVSPRPCSAMPSATAAAE